MEWNGMDIVRGSSGTAEQGARHEDRQQTNGAAVMRIK
jgi:hypothetical protein